MSGRKCTGPNTGVTLVIAGIFSCPAIGLGDSRKAEISDQTIYKECSTEVKKRENEEFQIFLSTKVKVAIKQCYTGRIEHLHYIQMENEYFESKAEDNDFRKSLGGMDRSHDMIITGTLSKTVSNQREKTAFEINKDRESSHPSRRPLTGFQNLSGADN
jgi:hypothetical protein